MVLEPAVDSESMTDDNSRTSDLPGDAAPETLPTTPLEPAPEPSTASADTSAARRPFLQRTGVRVGGAVVAAVALLGAGVGVGVGVAAATMDGPSVHGGGPGQDYSSPRGPGMRDDDSGSPGRPGHDDGRTDDDGLDGDDDTIAPSPEATP